MVEEKGKRFKITYCTSCGYRDRAVQISDQLEKDFKEQSLLEPATNGVFDIEDNNVLMFSKLECGRFPEDGEIKTILENIYRGLDLREAKSQAALSVGRGDSIIEWFFGLFRFQ